MSPENEEEQEMQPEYDIRGGVRGKYFLRYTGELSLQDPQWFQWVQSPKTASRGTHPSESTIQIGAEPIYLTLTLKSASQSER